MLGWLGAFWSVASGLGMVVSFVVGLVIGFGLGRWHASYGGDVF